MHLPKFPFLRGGDPHLIYRKGVIQTREEEYGKQKTVVQKQGRSQRRRRNRHRRLQPSHRVLQRTPSARLHLRNPRRTRHLRTSHRKHHHQTINKTPPQNVGGSNIRGRRQERRSASPLFTLRAWPTAVRASASVSCDNWPKSRSSSARISGTI